MFTSSDPKPIYGRTDMEVTVTNIEYSSALDDPTSDTYTHIASVFCAEVYTYMFLWLQINWAYGIKGSN